MIESNKRLFLFLLMLSSFAFAESDEMRCLKRTGCRWLCQLEYSAFFPGSRAADELQRNASIEAANGGCPEYKSEKDCVDETGCRWFCKLEHASMPPGSNFAEQVRRNAIIEVRSGMCSAKE